MFNTCAIFDVARMYPTKIRIVTEPINHKLKKKYKKKKIPTTGYLLSFRSIFSLISSFVIDWIVFIEWQLRHSSFTHNQYIIVPPDGQMAPCVVGRHPASSTMGTGSLPGIKSGRSVTLTPHSLLVPLSWKSRAIPLLPLWAVRPVRGCTSPFTYLGMEWVGVGKLILTWKEICRIVQWYCSIWRRKRFLMHWCRVYYCLTEEPPTE
jgi:hypothetical protein